MDEKRNILNTIDTELLDEWVPVKKKRIKKIYEVVSDTEVKFVNENSVEEGVGVEFTEIYLETMDQLIYTIGLEAFGASNKKYENLTRGIKNLKIELTIFKDLDSYGYPQLLYKFGNESK